MKMYFYDKNDRAKYVDGYQLKLQNLDDRCKMNL